MKIEPIIIPVKKIKEEKEVKKKKTRKTKVKKEIKKQNSKPEKKETVKPKTRNEFIEIKPKKEEKPREVKENKPVKKIIKKLPPIIEDEKAKELMKQELNWKKGPKPSKKEPPETQYAFKPTPEELELMKKFESEEREKNILKPTPEEEKLMEEMREPDLVKELKPTPEEMLIMEEEGIKEPDPENRSKTGIEGIDELTHGGLPRNKAIAIVGGPGAGKSIFLMQYLINGAQKYHEPGIYVTFEETIDELKSDFKNFKFNIDELERKGLIKIVNYNPMKIKRFIKNMDVTFRDLIKEMGAKRVVIDSLSAFTLLFNNEGEQREGLFQLFSALKKLKVTTLLSSESWREPTITKSGVIEFIADGVIMLYNLRIGDTRVRAVEILKMRGIEHEARIVPFKINKEGIRVFIDEEVFGNNNEFSKF